MQRSSVRIEKIMGEKSTFILVTFLLVLLSTSVLPGVRNVILRKNLQKILKVSYLENIPGHIKKVKEKFPKANIIINKNGSPQEFVGKKHRIDQQVFFRHNNSTN